MIFDEALYNNRLILLMTFQNPCFNDQAMKWC